jgi:uncharacterized protein (TIGR02246 family)
MQADEQAVRDHHAMWMAAVNAADVARLLSLMTQDVVLLNPGGEPLGRDGFPALFLGAHERFELRCVSELQEVVVVGDLAYSRCHDTLSLVPRAGGGAVALAGHRITVYRRQADGRWLLARDAHTLVP